MFSSSELAWERGYKLVNYRLLELHSLINPLCPKAVAFEFIN